MAWSELFPWLKLVSALRLAASAPLLLTATLAVLLLPLGWQLSGRLFGVPAGAEAVVIPQANFSLLNRPAAEAPTGFAQPAWGVPQSWHEFVAPMLSLLPGGVPPVRHLFRIDGSWRQFGYVAVGTLWNVLVWAFFGAVIVRTAVMQLGRDERVGLWDAARFAARRYPALAGAPFFPLLGVVVIVLCAIPVGWLMRWDLGMLLAGALWLLVLLGGFLVAILLIGLLLGWPLMWAALSTEEMGDVFEAAQRSYSYALGRPLHYAGYALVAVMTGSAAFLAAQWFAAWVVYLSLWTVSWGAGSGEFSARAGEPSALRLTGEALIIWWSQLPLIVASAFRYAYFWTAAGVIYLLLRRDADQIEFDAVYAPDAAPPFTLPPLSPDAAGVPGVAAEG
ncbi:MAG: hypothetical protein MUF48_02115 [Pirellulaceae bacterium]|nr:hypothetical protein [Pirellulaceae bacterium]